MFSSLQGQGQTSPQVSTDPAQEPRVWKHWKHEHPEFKRQYATEIPFNGDKILILGGSAPGETQRTSNMILMDPETQQFQIIPPVGDDLQSPLWTEMSACYWKDSKVVVSGGSDVSVVCSTVAIISLKDLDSDRPSAHWEKIVTPTELRRKHHFTHIYQDKMYVFGGADERYQNSYDVWCLDLSDFTWSKCDFTGIAQQQRRPSKFVFHENKAYAILWGQLADLEAIGEFDLDKMSYKSLAVPKSQVDNRIYFAPLPKVIDQKIYFLEVLIERQQSVSPTRQILAFDLDSQNWTEIKAESSPNLDILGRILSCNNCLIFCAWEFMNGTPVFGEFWSLQLHTPKSSKASSTSTTLSKTQQTMKEFFFEAPYSDISFEVESEIIKAHKWWLIQKNKFFANMFASGMSEAQASKIKITDMKASTFRALLEFLYSDHVEIDDAIALELLQQADKYSIGELKTACEKHLIANIEPENYVALGQIAELIGAASLREAVVSFIAKNMKKIKPRKDFNDISDALLRDSLVKFIVK